MSTAIGKYVTAQQLQPGDIVVNGRNIRFVVSKEIERKKFCDKWENIIVMSWMGKRHEEDFELDFWSSQCRAHALFLLLENE